MKPRWLVAGHRWLGLTLGLVWALQGLTGALLVFHRDLAPLMHRDGAMSVAAMAPLSALVAAAGGAGGTVKRLFVTDGGGRVVEARVASPAGPERIVRIEAASGRVLAARAAEAGPGGAGLFDWVYRLHEKLLSGDRGEWLIGMSGLFLALTLGFGLVAAWPRCWAAVTAIGRWRNARARLFGWHRLAGLTLAALLVPVALTGSAMVFSAEVRSVAAAIAPFDPPFEAKPAGTIRFGPDAALVAARRHFPNARFVGVTLATPESALHRIRLRQPGETRAIFGTTSVWVDATSGGVVHVYDPLRAPVANQIVDAFYALHNGELAGLAGRLAVCAAGLALPGFYVTGLALWLGRRARRLAPVAAAVSVAAIRPGDVASGSRPSSPLASRSSRDAPRSHAASLAIRSTASAIRWARRGWARTRSPRRRTRR